MKDLKELTSEDLAFLQSLTTQKTKIRYEEKIRNFCTSNSRIERLNEIFEFLEPHARYAAFNIESYTATLLAKDVDFSLAYEVIDKLTDKRNNVSIRTKLFDREEIVINYCLGKDIGAECNKRSEIRSKYSDGWYKALLTLEKGTNTFREFGKFSEELQKVLDYLDEHYPTDKDAREKATAFKYF